MVFEGNPLRMELKSPLPKIWKAVGEHGLGHHWMAAYGHLAAALVEYCQLAGITGIFPDLYLLVGER